MLQYAAFNDNNEKLLCDMHGKNSDMLMTVKIKRLKENESMKLFTSENETAILMLKGDAQIKWLGHSERMKRKNPFEKKSFCLHACCGIPIEVIGNKDSEILIQQTNNKTEFEPVFYKPEDCLYQHFGKGQWDGAGYRICSTIFDYDNAPYSNMVLGEVFNQPGRWSSYPPHHHPQPEIYYYQFDPPQGFGACFNGENVYKSTDGAFCTITDGQDHQQVVAPGYTMYYVWMVRHLDGDPWYKTSRFYAKDHKWLVDAD